MKRGTNGWFMSRFLGSFLNRVSISATENHSDWLAAPECKYLDIRIDMRTGGFIVKDASGKPVSDETLKKIGLMNE